MAKVTRATKRPRPTSRDRSPLRLGLYAGAGGLALVLILLLLRPGPSSPNRPGPPPPQVRGAPLAQGQLAPDFTAATLDGSKLTLSSLRGRPVLLNFFASWCTECRAEAPALESAYTAHRSQGFTIVGVNALETGDGRAFYKALGWTYPAVSDPGQPGPIAAAYGVTQGLPASVFIDRAGRVAAIQYGAVDRQFIDRELQALG